MLDHQKIAAILCRVDTDQFGHELKKVLDQKSYPVAKIIVSQITDAEPRLRPLLLPHLAQKAANQIRRRWPPPKSHPQMPPTKTGKSPAQAF